MISNFASGRPSPQSAGTALADQPPGLAEEHDQLLCQVAARAEDLMAAVAGDHWPARELDALVGYLRAEILRQVTDEELLLFPACGTPPGRHHLAREHARLRAGIEVLELAAGNGGRSPAMLAGAVSDLLRQLEAHLAAEESILAACGRRGGTPATTTLGARFAYLEDGPGRWRVQVTRRE